MRTRADDGAKHVGVQETGKLLTFNTPFATREAYIKLRTNLMFCVNGSGDPCTTFLVTSGNPSEGKSLTAANVAISFAMLGKKTLLVDADMRRPSQRKLWAVTRGSAGLCDYLAGLSSLSLAHVDGIPLSLAFCGRIPPNPSELLSSTRMRHFLKACHERYDYVIVEVFSIKVRGNKNLESISPKLSCKSHSYFVNLLRCTLSLIKTLVCVIGNDSTLLSKPCLGKSKLFLCRCSVAIDTCGVHMVFCLNLVIRIVDYIRHVCCNLF